MLESVKGKSYYTLKQLSKNLHVAIKFGAKVRNIVYNIFLFFKKSAVSRNITIYKKMICMLGWTQFLTRYLLTPWSRVLLQKLTGSAASQEIPRILWNPKVHHRTHKCPHLFLSWANSIQSPPSPTSRRSILILSSHLRLGLPNGKYFLTKVFHREALLAPHPTPKLEVHPSSAVRDCLFNILAATIHIGGRSSTRNLR